MSKIWIGYQVWLHTILIGIAFLNIHSTYPTIRMATVAVSAPIITARDDVAPPDYKYRASEFLRATDKLIAPKVGE